MKSIKKMNEQELKESRGICPKSPKELLNYIKELTKRPHDYGTCVYAMSLAAYAAFNFVAHALEVTGMQAACADLDFLTRTRGLTHGFKILNFRHLLYPQYLDDEYFPSYEQLIEENKEMLKSSAEKLLKEHPDANRSVIEHWKKLAGM